MRLKRLAILTLSLSSLYATSAFSQEESATARQIIDKFQTELIHVMKDGKKLGYAGRYEKLEPAVVNSHDLPKIARIVVGKEGEKLTEEQQKKISRCVHAY